MSAARSTSSRWSTKNATWCSRPRVPVWSRVYVRSYDFWFEASQTPASLPSSSTICSVSRSPRFCSQEDAVLAGIDGEEVDVVEVAHADAASRIPLRLVLQRRPELGRRDVALGLVEELEAVAVRIEEAVRGAVAEVAVESSRRPRRPLRAHATRRSSASGLSVR